MVCINRGVKRLRQGCFNQPHYLHQGITANNYMRLLDLKVFILVQQIYYCKIHIVGTNIGKSVGYREIGRILTLRTFIILSILLSNKSFLEIVERIEWLIWNINKGCNGLCDKDALSGAMHHKFASTALSTPGRSLQIIIFKRTHHLKVFIFIQQIYYCNIHTGTNIGHIGQSVRDGGISILRTRRSSLLLFPTSIFLELLRGLQSNLTVDPNA